MTEPAANMQINGDRLWNSLMEMAEIGPGIAGGNNRQTLTDDDAKGRSLFQAWCDAEGLNMGVDQMGTMFAMRGGTDPVLSGTYARTVPGETRTLYLWLALGAKLQHCTHHPTVP